MKVLLLLLIPVLGLFSFRAPVSAHAQEAGARYAVAPTRDVWFCAAESDASRLFLIPYTYYVRVVAEGELYSSVEYLVDEAPYKKVYGYCRTDSLQFVDFVPERPYLRRELTLTYSLETPSSLGGGAFDTVERTCVYYGHRYEGARLYYYVLCDGEFDYIAATEELTYDYNTDYLVNTSTEEAPPEETGLGAGAIVAICLVCVVAVAIAVFVLRGKRPSPQESEHEF